MKKDYIQDLREKVGHEPLILNFAGGILVNERNEIFADCKIKLNTLEK